MENENIQPLEIAAAEPKSKYTRIDGYFALVFLFAGFALVKLGFFYAGALGAAVYGIALIGISAAFARLSKAKHNKSSIVFMALSVIFTLNLAISDNPVIRFLGSGFVVILYSLWAFTLNNPSYVGVDDNFIYMLLNALFGQSFGNFGKDISASVSIAKDTKTGGNIKNILVGLVFAFPVTIIAILLLSSADENFDRLFSGIWSMTFNSFFRNVIIFVFTLPISFLLFGIIYSAVSNKQQFRLDAEKCAQKTARAKIAPQTVIISAVTPLCIVYVLFFFSQLSYFVSAFANVLPEKFIASEYARRGFFELCAVAVINLAVIALINYFCVYPDGKRPKTLGFFTALISFFTLVLIATALSKMIMYINRYGLTELRYFTSWFMAVLAVFFVLIVLRQLFKFNLAKISTIIFTAMFVFLSFVPADYLIASFNISAYRDGHTESFDSSYISHLSYDASPAIKPLLDSNDKTLKSTAEQFYSRFTDSGNYYDCYYFDWRDINLAKVLASGEAPAGSVTLK